MEVVSYRGGSALLHLDADAALRLLDADHPVDAALVCKPADGRALTKHKTRSLIESTQPLGWRSPGRDHQPDDRHGKPRDSDHDAKAPRGYPSSDGASHCL